MTHACHKMSSFFFGTPNRETAEPRGPLRANPCAARLRAVGGAIGRRKGGPGNGRNKVHKQDPPIDDGRSQGQSVRASSARPTLRSSPARSGEQVFFDTPAAHRAAGALASSEEKKSWKTVSGSSGCAGATPRWTSYAISTAVWRTVASMR